MAYEALRQSSVVAAFANDEAWRFKERDSDSMQGHLLRQVVICAEKVWWGSTHVPRATSKAERLRQPHPRTPSVFFYRILVLCSRCTLEREAVKYAYTNISPILKHEATASIPLVKGMATWFSNTSSCERRWTAIKVSRPSIIGRNWREFHSFSNRKSRRGATYT